MPRFIRFHDILSALKSGASLQRRMTYQRSIHLRNKRSLLLRSKLPSVLERSYKKSRPQIKWISAPDIKKRIHTLAVKLHLDWLNTKNIYCVRSSYANTRAIARIWGLSRIWQIALRQKPKYIIEVVSEKFDRLGEIEKNKVLLHEIAHIPMNFSGSLVPHIRRGKRKFSSKVDILVAQYLKDR